MKARKKRKLYWSKFKENKTFVRIFYLIVRAKLNSIRKDWFNSIGIIPIKCLFYFLGKCGVAQAAFAISISFKILTSSPNCYTLFFSFYSWKYDNYIINILWRLTLIHTRRNKPIVTALNWWWHCVVQSFESISSVIFPS